MPVKNSTTVSDSRKFSIFANRKLMGKNQGFICNSIINKRKSTF